MDAGLFLQLGLLGLIAEAGGFEGISGRSRAHEYWSLSKYGDQFGKLRQPDKKMGPNEFLEHARRNFLAAARRWLTGDEPFTAKLNPAYAPYGDYDQLMRLEEWYGRNDYMLAARLLLDLGCVEQRGDDRRRADADRDAGLDELLLPLLAGFIPVAVVGHLAPLERRFRAHIYGRRARQFGSGALMAGRFKPLPTLEGAQAAAVDPNVHASVSASAGTGKTQVLTGSVLRLLLNGVSPEAILCLTFTKAGAAEMANRIGARLAAWVRMRDADLRKELYALGEDRPARRFSGLGGCSPRCSKLRAGFASRPSTASRRPLLAAFPAEAGITPGSSRSRAGRSRSWRGPRWPTCSPTPRRTGDEGLIGDVAVSQPSRLGEEGAVRYLMLCAAPEAMAALGSPEPIEPSFGRRWNCRTTRFEDSLRTIAMRIASTATCWRRSPTRIAGGARRPALAMPRRSTIGSR